MELTKAHPVGWTPHVEKPSDGQASVANDAPVGSVEFAEGAGCMSFGHGDRRLDQLRSLSAIVGRPAPSEGGGLDHVSPNRALVGFDPALLTDCAALRMNLVHGVLSRQAELWLRRGGSSGEVSLVSRGGPSGPAFSSEGGRLGRRFINGVRSGLAGL